MAFREAGLLRERGPDVWHPLHPYIAGSDLIELHILNFAISEFKTENVLHVSLSHGKREKV